MKIKNVSSKTIEFFKKNGKKIICTGLVSGAILMPFDEAVMEERDAKFIEPTKQSQTIDNNEIINEAREIVDQLSAEEKEELASIDNPIFIVESAWQKTDNYSDGLKYAKENREYQKTTRIMKPNELFNEDYFKDDYEKILNFISGEENINTIFKIINEKTEKIVVFEEEEKELNTTDWNMQVVGTNIKVSTMRQLTDKEKHDQYNLATLGAICLVVLVVFGMVCYEKIKYGTKIKYKIK